jgi:hypothetical protein
MTADRISIERLTSGVEIIIPGFGSAEVYGVRFDGEGYSVDYARSARGGWDDLDTHYVGAGGSVEFAGIGEPVLRGEDKITADEAEAKAAAFNERQLAGVTSKVLGDILGSAFPALQAAE